MLFSYNLLNEFVDLKEWPSEKLIQRLTFSGFEVEESHPATQATKVISGFVQECVSHPDSNHLHCLKVDLGPKYGIAKIVCGAPNVRQGEKVIVALPGCKLDAIQEVIKPGVIRGQESNGMCCSLIEVGLDKNVLPEEEKNGITLLPKDFPIGDEEVLDHIGLKDTIIDISVLPNRPDCLCYYGMAREIAALTGAPLKPLGLMKLSNLPDKIKVSSVTADCPKIDLLSASLNPSSMDSAFADKIKKYLWLSGLPSNSPLVDLGNFMMLLTGNPFHIYDADKAHATSLTATSAFEGDFKALDGKTYALKKNDIVIVNQDHTPLALAGILGGEASKDSDSTATILVEAASFHHSTIRHTSARLGVSSSSSILFGKGVNPNLVDFSLQAFAFYLSRLYPQAKLESFSSFTGDVKKPQPFSLSLERLNHRLGTDYSQAELQTVLKAYDIQKVGEGKVIGPLWRTDLNEQADVDEEVFRFYPATRVPLSYSGLPLTCGGLSLIQQAEKNIRELLLGYGLSEILTFTLVNEKQADQVRCFYQGEGYKITNPLTKDHEYVRVDLIPSMIETLDRNNAHSYSDLALFEIGSVDTPKGNIQLLSIGFSGLKEDQELYGAKPYDFYDLKAIADGILSILGIASSRVKLVRSTNPKFHPGKSADLFVGKEKVATFGALHPQYFKEEYLVGEFNLDALLKVRTGNTKFTPFNQYPIVRRDLSFDLLGEVNFADLVAKVKRSSKGLLKDVQLFDHYENPKTNKKSLGIALFIGSDDHTLKEEEINGEMNAITMLLTSSYPLALRK